MKVNVLLADDHRLFRETLVHFFTSTPDIRAIGQAESGAQLLELVPILKPDVVLLDVDMPGLSGLECAEQLSANLPQLPVILLTMHDLTVFRHWSRALANIKAYLLKSVDPQELLDTIRSVTSATQSSSPAAPQPVVSHLAPAEKLTRQEVAVLRLMLAQLSNEEIAARLFNSVRTIEGHRSKIYQKVGARTLVGIVQYALEHELITAEELKVLVATVR